MDSVDLQNVFYFYSFSSRGMHQGLFLRVFYYRKKIAYEDDVNCGNSSWMGHTGPAGSGMRGLARHVSSRCGRRHIAFAHFTGNAASVATLTGVAVSIFSSSVAIATL